MTIIDGPKEATPTWLASILDDCGIDARVSAVVISVVGAGQMASCYRLSITYSRGSGPSSLIIKVPSDDPEVRSSVAAAYLTEVGFYRDLAPRLPVAVPRCYFAEATEDGTSFTLVLADMAPAVAGDQIAGCTAGQARDAVIAIAGLHAGSWCDESTLGLAWLIPPTDVLTEHIAPMMPDITEAFVAKRSLTPATVDVLRRFAADFGSWGIDPSPRRSLVHNDHRLDNLLFAADGTDPRVTIVDWQALTTGPPLRDVAFLIGTGLAPEERRTHERDIVFAYFRTLEALGVDAYDFDSCFDDYRRALFHGPFISIMGDTFAASSDRGLEMFSAMVERSAAAILDLDAFATLTARQDPT